MRVGVVCAGAFFIAGAVTVVLILMYAFGQGRTESAAARPPIVVLATRPIKPVEPAPAAPKPAEPAQAAPQVAAAPIPAASPETTGSVGGAQQIYVNGSRVALRSSPDAKSKILDRMSDGQKLMEMARSGEWVRVRVANSDTEGWVNEALVSAAPAKKK